MMDEDDPPPTLDRLQVPHRRAVTIEYPGHILDPAKALVTLGGLDAVTTALDASQNDLQLRLRPADPLCHPIFGERQPCRGLLLRVSSRKGDVPDDDDDASAAAAAATRVTVAARIHATYTFRALADFQYVPVDPGRAQRSLAALPASNQPAAAEPFGVPQPLLMVPPLFSRHDVPADVPEHFEAISDQQRQAAAVASAAQREVPWGAHELPRAQPLPDTLDPQLVAALQQLLERHPIWPPLSLREALRQHLQQQQQRRQQQQQPPAQGGEEPAAAPPPPPPAGEEPVVGSGGPVEVSPADLEAALRATCYQFAKGPWRNCWIRCGFDPRSDVSACVYQMVSYRLPSDWHTYVKRRRAEKDPVPEPSISALQRFEVMPTAYNTTLQLAALEDPVLQRQLQDAARSSACSESNGWFTSTALTALQQAVAQRFEQVLQAQIPAVREHMMRYNAARAAAAAAFGAAPGQRLEGLEGPPQQRADAAAPPAAAAAAGASSPPPMDGTEAAGRGLQQPQQQRAHPEQVGLWLSQLTASGRTAAAATGATAGSAAAAAAAAAAGAAAGGLGADSTEEDGEAEDGEAEEGEAEGGTEAEEGYSMGETDADSTAWSSGVDAGEDEDEGEGE